MIIDSHAHVILPKEKQVSLMKAAGVDRTVLFASSIHPEMKENNIHAYSEELDNLYAILQGTKNPMEDRLASIKELASIVNENPTRYIGFGSIPFGLSYSENMDWITKNIVSNGFKGIGELAPGTGKIQHMEALFQAAQDAGNLPLWVHTFFPLNFNDIKELLLFGKKHPTVPLILGHLGGIHWLDTLKAVRDMPNVYLDLSATYTTIAPTFAIREYPERTLFSSDAPYASPMVARTILEQITPDKAVLQMVLGDTIAQLLDL